MHDDIVRVKVSRKHTRLRSRRVSYWLVAIGLIYIGVIARDWMDDNDFWASPNYRVFNLLQKLSPRELSPKRTALVLIEDQEYWKGELAGRVPIKRSYLAKLIKEIDKADPAVIALDFDFRSPAVDGSLQDNPEYVNETRELIEAINSVSAQRPVVVTNTVMFDADGDYVLESSIFGQNSFRNRKNITTGYILLPYDIRQVPLPITLKDSTMLESFSGAIVRMVDNKVMENLGADSNFPYGSFIPADKFTRVSSAQILTDFADSVKSKLQHKIVIVGGNWHSNAFNRGRVNDSYDSPVGELPGAFIHANYVEAILNDRTYSRVNEIFDKGIEISLAGGIAVCFGMNLRPIRKTFYLALTLIAFLMLGYILYQNLGLVCDLFVPSVLILGHITVEQILEWKRDAREYQLLQSKS